MKKAKKNIITQLKDIVSNINLPEIFFSSLPALFIAATADILGLEFDTLGAWFLFLAMWRFSYLYFKKKNELEEIVESEKNRREEKIADREYNKWVREKIKKNEKRK